VEAGIPHGDGREGDREWFIGYGYHMYMYLGLRTYGCIGQEVEASGVLSIICPLKFVDRDAASPPCCPSYRGLPGYPVLSAHYGSLPRQFATLALGGGLL